jgi:hypothetical protein
MKGGKDMTKIYTMYNNNDKYIIKSENVEIFEVPKSTLNVDGKKLYEALFKEFKKGDIIKINKSTDFDSSNDKISKAVYDSIVEVVNKIVTGINEL